MKEFVKGFYYNDPHPNAPDFVRANISIQKAQFTEWLETQHENAKGYIKIDVLLSKDREKTYAVLNDFKPKKNQIDREDMMSQRVVINPEECGEVPF